MLAGVAGGLAEHWDADPSLVRLVWALLVIFTGGIALIVYIVMALILPDGPVTTLDASAEVPRDARRVARRDGTSRGGRTAGIVFGLLLMLFGVWFLIDEVFPAFDTDVFWPIALIILGVALLGLAFRPGREAPAAPPPAAPPPAAPPPAAPPPAAPPPAVPPPGDAAQSAAPGHPAGAGS
jgi:phage shock protein PspC (stress-responsive transcriptional regulator)